MSVTIFCVRELKRMLLLKKQEGKKCMKKLLVNKIRCKKCGDIIESKTVHDFLFCKCKSVAVDGGLDYIRRVGAKEDWEELSVYETVDDESIGN